MKVITKGKIYKDIKKIEIGGIGSDGKIFGLYSASGGPTVVELEKVIRIEE